MSDSQVPTCRWGIITVGLISSWFVADLVAPRPDAKAKHVIQAIGASSEQKGKDFIKKYITDADTGAVQHNPTLYSSYDEVYNDPNVDCVYIGSPHGLHYRDLKNAINAGKNVLCEKAFTINAREAREVFALAREKNVYVAEAMWLRHRPLIRDIRKQLYDDKVIGDVFRTACDFRMGLDFSKLDKNSRHLIPELGAGSLLDIGIYSLTWAILTLDPSTPAEGGLKGKSSAQGQGDLETSSEQPVVLASQSFEPTVGVETSTAAILRYPSSGRQGVITSTMNTQRGAGHHFATIEGTEGFIEVEGNAPSHPTKFTVYPKWVGVAPGSKPKPLGSYEYPLKPYQGFIYEADNTALDIAAGRKESSVMPWAESVRVMEIMDSIRQQGGTVYPQDK
ncbi:putative dimeric dihydrodiol dehydrogenase [Microdochium trichocladiopsis]|uniref:D-xylose 1-dehydrogenase (NADP(+), D-xylono-1,5-lactone-forming) n=1 Tax=Microdochium trichocladiopsis TaxID=1682393 RepID=A0A9P8Y1C8_9PEZI|nr:putative dimeric dihydrodiol dehydrogenase [Microdochium trichocladiopsis]KAH7025041.1 putative dimeric dihydrodiol dehydrogenase [Microdochium trichocladiopsis]